MSHDRTARAADVSCGHHDVAAALNRACDDIIEAAALPDAGVRDALNLLVNAGLAYLDGSAADLAGVTEASYGEPLETVLGWLHG